MKMSSEIEQEKGFALVEVIIALAIVAIIASGFLLALSTSSRAIFTADERTTAESLARSQLEYVKSQIYDDINNPPVYSKLASIPANYDIVVTAVWLDPKNDGPGDDGLQKITVTIAHLGNIIITLEDYKVDR